MGGPPAFDYDEKSRILFEMEDLNPGCEVKYECGSIVRVDKDPLYDTLTCDIDFFKEGNNIYFLANHEDYRKQRFAPGVYEVTMTGSAVSDPTLSHQVSVYMELKDICDPPTTLQVKPDIVTTYTIE